MNHIILSADSTCDLGNTLKEQYDVHYFPYHIILEEKDYLDNVDITPEEIYKIYYDRKVLPKTSAINVEEYIDYLKVYTDNGNDVIHFNLGGALSSSYQNCKLAAQELPGVYPINSCSLSTGIGLQVLDAADMIKEGKSAKEIYDTLHQSTEQYHASFIVDTLTFLHAGGRCSSAAKLGANLLNLKPCIEVDNTTGGMTVGKKYRGNLEKVLVHYVKDKLQQYPDIVNNRIFITHSTIDSHYIDIVRDTINSVMHFDHIYVTNASCTISSHCGPGTLGILFKTETKAK